jgi:hypothetical protein
MSLLVEQLPSGPGVALDLLIGAGAAYVRDQQVIYQFAGIGIAGKIDVFGTPPACLPASASNWSWTSGCRGWSWR